MTHLRELLCEAPQWGTPEPLPLHVVKAAVRIEGDAQVGPDRAALGEFVDTNPRKLATDFKAFTGLTLRRYRQWVKVAHAIEYASAGLGLAHAGEKAGFAGAPHLTRSLRELLGSVPSVVPFERALMQQSFFASLQRQALG